jgi:mannose-6-phosphate isomerase-like protein (cupin superfamily)
MKSFLVCEDFRGEIRKYEIDGVNFNVLLTRAGAYRGGDYHPNTQYNLILKGEFEITLRQNNKDITLRKGPNELIKIPPNTPHLFKSLTDTIMIEYWDGPFKARYYEPYRKFVEKQFEQYEK